MSSIDPVMQLVINAYRLPYERKNVAVNRILSNSESLRVVKLWIENHPAEVSHSPMLKDLKNRVYALNAGSLILSIFQITLDRPAASDIESKLLSGRFFELSVYFNRHPNELIKNFKLIQTHLKLKILEMERFLPILLDKLSTKALTVLLSAETLNPVNLSKIQNLRLSALLAKPDNLPPYAQNFRQILQQPKDLANIREFAGLTKEEKDAAIALYIEHHEIPLCEIKQKLTDEEFLRLAPHLRYVDLQNFADIPLAKELLQKCSNINVLYIDNDKMLEKVALPLCEMLICRDCKNLQLLPALPLCNVLDCSGCSSLLALPALPYCKQLDCSGCSSLQELPVVPLCKELYCNRCTKLMTLPALPLCEKLACGDCINLQELPVLPLCKELYCNRCTKLMTLPALPLCYQLACEGCTSLQALPLLPLCKVLGCNDCPKFQDLPALSICEILSCDGCPKLLELPVVPLCKELYCNRCTGLHALPALPLCERLACMNCTNLKTLPALPLCKEISCEGCTSLQELPELPLCEELHCNDCPSLQALPALPLCKELYCKDCTCLQALPALPLCEKLDCEGCIKLQALSALPLCIGLSCQGCTTLQELPALPLCKELYCKGCTCLQALPALPLCEKLDCEGCIKLQELPALLLCEKLGCQSCTNLQALPALPLCEKLDCEGCIKLQELPELPLCKVLCCKDCTKLQALPALPLCETLACEDCPKLQTLPALPLCKELYCCGCTCLQVLPALPLCEKLACEDCTKLQTLPALPLGEKLYCSGCRNLTTLPLSLGKNMKLTTIDIADTGIDPAVRNAILNQCRLMRERINILHSRVAKWKSMAKSDGNLDVSALSIERKDTLNEWLDRLERTHDFASSKSLLAHTVCDILADALKNKEFEEMFFLQAESNNTHCGDRAAMSLNEIYTSWKIICTPGNFPLKEKLKMMTGVAKTLLLRKALQKLIKANEGESVEIFLYYESMLSQELKLVTAIQGMNHSTIGKRNWIDKKKLVKDVKDNFFNELFELPAFAKMLVEVDLFNEIDSELLDKLEELGDRPKGSELDTNVLNYQFKEGEITLEWKKKKMQAAKQWYDKAIN